MVDYKNPRLVIETSKLQSGSVSWRSPSNLAIIKYWGKHGDQLPRNPSISFTLDNAFTETTLEYRPKKGVDRGLNLRLFFHGKENEAFRAKVAAYLDKIGDIFPFLRQLDLMVKTTNSFPHSSGIASSASGMSALALCLCTMEDNFFGTLPDDESFRRKASYLARLGSGSACRSIYPQAAIWGASGEVNGSSDLYAIPYEESLHPVFHSLHDAILIVSKGAKKVSSRAGHGLMNENIYAEQRFRQARQRFHQLLLALKNGEIELFGQIAEQEALTLHALMMTSSRPYLLMEPNTVELIHRIQDYRHQKNLPVYFSLDAGPNIHLLYPDQYKKEVEAFIQSDLAPWCIDQQWVADRVGEGPLQL